MHYFNYMYGIGSSASFAELLPIIIIWSLFWKGLALWHSAKREKGWWFVILLTVNTMGILEIIFLFAVLKLKFSKLFPGKKKEEKYKKERETRPQVVLVNRCIIINKDGKFLLVKRSPNDYNAPGLWEFPGGKLEEGQDVSQALEREVFEETGLSLTTTTRVAFVESYIIPKGKYEGMPFVVIIGIGKNTDDKVTLSEEHTEYKWVTYDEALSMNIKNEIRSALISLKEKLF